MTSLAFGLLSWGNQPVSPTSPLPQTLLAPQQPHGAAPAMSVAAAEWCCASREVDS
jgi:hypothetical protein